MPLELYLKIQSKKERLLYKPSSIISIMVKTTENMIGLFVSLEFIISV